jgi:hypothetical protein
MAFTITIGGAAGQRSNGLIIKGLEVSFVHA